MPGRTESNWLGETLTPVLGQTGSGHPAAFMIADAVRYMSVHSRKQPDPHGHNGTSTGEKQ